MSSLSSSGGPLFSNRNERASALSSSGLGNNLTLDQRREYIAKLKNERQEKYGSGKF